MNNIKKEKLNNLGFNFIDPKYIPEEKDEFYLRYEQNGNRDYRSLSIDEINILKNKGNTADNWNNIKVTDNFSPNRIKNSNFYGLIRIGDIDDIYLDFHDIHQPVGIYNSTIVSCDIGSNVAISNVNYLSHYIIHDTVILININEMITTNYSKFGNGILKDDEVEDVRIKIEVSNENGNRAILPFEGILSSDAYLWSKFRDDQRLMKSMQEITDNQFSTKRGYYGEVSHCTVIKNCKIIKDVKVGSHAYIKGCNKLKNLTINSHEESSTQLGEGIELVNGIIGYGCRIFYGVKAIRFILSDYSTLKYGARLINSFLGSNSTISCCEVLNSLIYPSHEQHHNNSFLCAATIKGQSNIASGATIGSNHNSRANDGEIVAERGFWPGLCTSLKHNSKFSSYNLLAKGSYPSEINNPLPFSLISNNEKDGELSIIPAYWFMYNLYALTRNSWKYIARDKRKNKIPEIEYNYLAPDTINEILNAMDIILNSLDSKNLYKKLKRDDKIVFLKDNPLYTIESQTIENSNRPCRIYKAGKAYFIYRDFVLFYIVTILIEHSQKKSTTPNLLISQFDSNEEINQWKNIGGLLVRDKNLTLLLDNIKNGHYKSWKEIHNEYKILGENYNDQKLEHAIQCFNHLFAHNSISYYKNEFQRVAKYIDDGTYFSRKKDYENDFRLSTYDNMEEMENVIGKLEENSFIKHINKETEKWIELSNKFL